MEIREALAFRFWGLTPELRGRRRNGLAKVGDERRIRFAAADEKHHITVFTLRQAQGDKITTHLSEEDLVRADVRPSGMLGDALRNEICRDRTFHEEVAVLPPFAGG